MTLSIPMLLALFACMYDILKYFFIVNFFYSSTNVDIERQTITLLSPQPKPLPNSVLILSELQFMDSH